MSPRVGPILSMVGLDVVRRNWGWFLALGIVQIVLGIIAVGDVFTIIVTIFSVVMLGWLLIIGGVLSIVHAFMERQWGGFFIDLLTGVFYGVAGFMMVANPGAAAITLTLVISMFLIVGGIFRIIESLTANLPHKVWVFLNGIVTLILGILIWRQWPLSGLWVIGLFVGIEMLLYGWSLVMLSIAAKNMAPAAPSTA